MFSCCVHPTSGPSCSRPLLSLFIHVAHRLLSRNSCALIALPNRWTIVALFFVRELLLRCLCACGLLLFHIALLVLVLASATHPAHDLDRAPVSKLATLQLFTSPQNSSTARHVHIPATDRDLFHDVIHLVTHFHFHLACSPLSNVLPASLPFSFFPVSPFPFSLSSPSLSPFYSCITCHVGCCSLSCFCCCP